MRILLVHNFYQQPGGEDDVFATERDLLRAHGHEVITYERHNDEIEQYGLGQKLTLALRTTWAWDSCDALRDLLRKHRPHVVHFQNTFPLISPAAYSVCREAGVPVVQNINNARLLCPGSNYYRDGRICRDCDGSSVPWRGVLHGCYQESRARTAVVAGMLTFHRMRRTFEREVDAYIVLSEFYRQLLLDGGFDPQRVFCKPCFVPSDPGTGGTGDYALFIGRLSKEKGAHTLAAAWRHLPDVPLKVRGGGQLLPEFQKLAAENPQVELVPRLEGDAYFELIRNARFLVWPSIGYYETFGRVAIEAFAAGVPVVGSGVGANGELVVDGKTGLRFDSEDPSDIAAKVRWAWEHPDKMRRMGRNARAEYEARYTPERNYDMLMEIYERVIAAKKPVAGPVEAHA